VTPTGFEADLPLQRLAEPRSVSSTETSENELVCDQPGGVTQSLAAVDCHTVTDRLRAALVALDAGRLDLARAELLAILEGSREQR
jgi:hypothetical protein